MNGGKGRSKRESALDYILYTVDLRLCYTIIRIISLNCRVNICPCEWQERILVHLSTRKYFINYHRRERSVYYCYWEWRLSFF